MFDPGLSDGGAIDEGVMKTVQLPAFPITGGGSGVRAVAMDNRRRGLQVQRSGSVGMLDEQRGEVFVGKEGIAMGGEDKKKRA